MPFQSMSASTVGLRPGPVRPLQRTTGGNGPATGRLNDPSEALIPQNKAQLDLILQAARSKNTEEQLAAARQLRSLVLAEALEGCPERLGLFQRYLNEGIRELFKTRRGVVSSAVGGIRCISALIDVDFGDPNLIITQFTNYLGSALQTENREQMTLAAETLGKIVRIEKENLTHPIVDAETKRCLEWLGTDVSLPSTAPRRYAAASVLRELVQAVPYLLFQNLPDFLHHVWAALQDADLGVREVGASALRALVDCVASSASSRETPVERASRERSLLGILQKSLDNLSKEECRCHGALLALAQLYGSQEEADRVRTEKFGNVCSTVVRLKSAKSSQLVRGALLDLMPVLAEFDQRVGPAGSGEFAAQVPTIFREFVFGVLESKESPVLRASAFRMTGKVVFWLSRSAYSLRTISVEALERLIGIIRDVLTSANKLAQSQGASTLRSRRATSASGDDAQYGSDDSGGLAGPTNSDKFAGDRRGGARRKAGGFGSTIDSLPPTRRRMGSEAGQGRSSPDLLSSHENIIGVVNLSGSRSSEPGGPGSEAIAAVHCLANLAAAYNVAGTGNDKAFCSAKTHQSFMMHAPDPDESINFTPDDPESIHSALVRTAALHETCRSCLSALPPGDHLAAICAAVPELLPECQMRLLDRASQAFIGRPYPPDNFMHSPSIGSTSTDHGSLLAILSVFDLTGHDLSHFVLKCLLPLFSSPSPAVRKSAAHCALRLLGSSDDYFTDLVRGTPSAKLLGEPISTTSANETVFRSNVLTIVARLVAVAAGDPDADTRLEITDSLLRSVRFDSYAATTTSLPPLMIVLNDESVPVRRAGTMLLGRLASVNPARCLPALRTSLVQLLAELQCTTDAGRQELAAATIGDLVQVVPSLVVPYMQALLKSVMQRLTQTNPNLNVTLFSTLGQLADVAGTDTGNSVIEHTMPLIVATMRERSTTASTKAAALCFGALVQATGKVELLEEHPQMLELLMGCLHGVSKEPLDCRLAVMGVLGAAGAINPETVKRMVEVPESSGRVRQQRSSVAWQPQDGDFCTEAVVNALLGVLEQPSLFKHHQSSVQALTMILRTARSDSRPHPITGLAPRLLPAFLRLLEEPGRSSDRRFVEFMFRQLGLCVGVVKQHVRRYLPGIMKVVTDFWDTEEQSVLGNIIELCKELRVALNEEFTEHVRWLVPKLMPLLGQDKSDHRLTAVSISALEALGSLLEGYLHLVVPALADVFSGLNTPPSNRLKSLQTLKSLCGIVNLAPFASSLIHPLLRTIQEPAQAQALKIPPSSPAGDGLGGLESPRGPGQARVPATVQNEAAALLQQLMVSLKEAAETFLPATRAALGAASEPAFPPGKSPQDYMRNIEGHIQQLSSRRQMTAPELEQLAYDTHRPFQRPAMQQEIMRTEMATNKAELKKAWDSSRAVTDRDFAAWLSNFSLVLLEQSPSGALRATFNLARSYPQLSRELFPVAFVSCYNELGEERPEMLAALRTALLADNIPGEVLQQLLNLTEYMGRYDLQRPMFRTDGQDRRIREEPPGHGAITRVCPSAKLSELAMRCELYAKALYYREQQVRQLEQEVRRANGKAGLPTVRPERWPAAEKANCLEACRTLVYIANCLDLPASSEGLLLYIKKNLDQSIGLDEDDGGGGLTADMYKNLGWWEKALNCYQKDYGEAEPRSEAKEDALVGMFRCLDHMSDWHKLLGLAREHWNDVSSTTRERLAAVVAHAGWLMSQWDVMDDATKEIVKRDNDIRSGTGEFYKALLALHKGNREEAMSEISKCRAVLDGDLTTQAAESYARAYEVVVCLQQLTELAEVHRYRELDDPKKKAVMRTTWEKRIAKMSQNIKYLQGTLALRSLVLEPNECLDSWLDFVDTCVGSGSHSKASEVLTTLLARDMGEQQTFHPEVVVMSTKANPRVVLRYLRHLWSDNEGLEERHEVRQRLLRSMSDFAEKSARRDVEKNIQSECRLLTATWQQELQPETFFLDPQRKRILSALRTATELDSENHQAWHEWALMNYRIVLRDEGLSRHEEADSVVRAVEGFTRAILLCKPQELAVQDLLRMLRILVNCGGERVDKAVEHGVDTIPVEQWLQVVPQLIARIDASEEDVRSVMHRLLLRIASKHPQAIVYPLVVSCTSLQDLRASSARKVLQQVRALGKAEANLVDQAELVAHELIRVAITWSEKWLEGLEVAARQYWQEWNFEGMFLTLEPLHKMMDHPVSESDKKFVAVFGKDLAECYRVLKAHRETHQGQKGREKEREQMQWKPRQCSLTQAWDLYYTVSRRIQMQLPQIKTMDLDQYSRQLCGAKDLSVSVPGRYQAGAPTVGIKGFASHVRVIPSKRRPRVLTMIGDDGLDWKFLLKGHEDLRQDERVMQLFGLVNTLLRHHLRSSSVVHADLTIEQYPVVPLSNDAGLIGWLENADTLHSLISDYRDQQGVSLSAESKLMQQHAPGNYDNLNMMQKVEALEFALANTEGDDLGRILWLKAGNAEVWLERRTAYTRSLATMSMVGYILGLGDRHPSNLMMQSTGKVAHIDFGDCFEVAMHREKFPERIPFRLTRILVNAMEVCGCDGIFRRSCETVMTVLRNHRDSLMAMLEAFVHDPLLSWVLCQKLETATDKPKPPTNQPPAAQVPPASGGIDASSFQARGPDGALDRYSRSVVEKSILVRMQTIPVQPGQTEENPQAKVIVERIRDKLRGTDFPPPHRAIRVTKAKEDTIYPEGHPRRSRKLLSEACRESAITSVTTATLAIVVLGLQDDAASIVPIGVGSGSGPSSLTYTVVQGHSNHGPASSAPAGLRSGSSGGLQGENLRPLNSGAALKIQSVFRGMRARKDHTNTTKFSKLKLFLGEDQKTEGAVTVDVQVDRLITSARAHENLAQCYIGWCAFW
eukprot:Hpha_TRINITY_DN12120_c0_g1::TRINITY_DN12120_c0_g1_i1::g.82064::m.82064/K07203/MTOR, FRAP, TOR; serine/threonine-protein kinase mTOR